jgi:two-component sensor histidine kinase
VPIMITSGFSTPPNVVSINPAVFRVVAKPYKPQDVVKCLREIETGQGGVRANSGKQPARTSSEPGMAAADTADTSQWEVANLRHAIEAAGVALWSWNVDTGRLTMDERGFGLWGLSVQGEVTFEDLSRKIHPADRDRVRAAFAATRAVTGSYETDFRILKGDEVRWISARGQGADSGIVGYVMFGIFLDVTGRKQAEEAHELLAGEMSHRVKNLLAIASSLTAITSRSATSAEDMAQDLTARLSALGRAHDLVRPALGKDRGAALVGDLITVLLAPYDDMGAFTGRVRVSVPRLAAGDGAATNLALILHELATNSVKYGALSVASGTLDVACTVQDDDVTLVWTERGGPKVEKPAEEGFGSKLIARMASQLGGAFSSDWSTGGVIVNLSMRKDRLAI